MTKIYKFLFAFVIIFAIVTRFFNLAAPQEKYFDEIYHVPSSQLILENDLRSYEWWHGPIDEEGNYFDWLHPPIAKLFQAASMSIFGQNAFGWRFASAFFGVLVIIAVYYLVMVLFNDKSLALLAAFISCFDGLLLVQSRIAMNDIFLTFWILLVLIFYFTYLKLKKVKLKHLYLLLIGLCLGIAIATKWSGVFILIYVLILELIKLLQLKQYKRLPFLIFAILFLPTAVYFLSFSHMFLQGKSLNHFIDLHRQIVWYQTHRNNIHAYQSKPWQWFFNVRPVWYWKGQVSDDRLANIYALGNPVLTILGVIAVIYFSCNFCKELVNKKINIFTPKLLLLFAYFMTWLPWILSPRILFFHHYTPAVPLMAILIALLFKKFWKNLKLRPTLVTLLLICTLSFFIYYAHWTGISVSKSTFSRVYFALSSWK